eukprot:maker-scaffold618_size123335-snap-gene-0.26 protein:Tk08347 transcript:maker-scaffold618_size123335-snap-gene-0.26-mRNA-1 annotation:"PREDICTED: uncharacterized protein LOC100374539"
MSRLPDWDTSSVYSKDMIKNTHHFLKIEFLARAFSIVVWLTIPLFMGMVVLGYLHKADCPAEPRVSRFLFFCGTAGSMVLVLRLINFIQWKRLQHQYGRFDPSTHPGLSLVDAIMYVFVVFVVCLLINANSFVFSFHPVMDDPESKDFCHPNPYFISFLLVLVFDIVGGSAFLLWLTAIILGICNPDFLVMYGYFLDESEMKFNLREKIRKRRKKSSNTMHVATAANAFAGVRSSQISDEESIPEKTPLRESRSHPIEAIKSDHINTKARIPIHSPDSVDGDVEKNVIPAPSKSGRFSLSPPAIETTPPTASRFNIKPVKAKTKPVYGVEPLKDTSFSEGGGGGNNKTRMARFRAIPEDFSDFEDADDYDEDEDRTNLSIVRFSNAVNSRRISVDDVNLTRLDITKFPSGPLRQNSSDKLDSPQVPEEEEEDIR